MGIRFTMSKVAASKAKEKAQGWDFNKISQPEKVAVAALIAGGGVAGIAGIEGLAQAAIPAYGQHRAEEKANMDAWQGWANEQLAAGVPMEEVLKGGFLAAPIPYPEKYGGKREVSPQEKLAEIEARIASRNSIEPEPIPEERYFGGGEVLPPGDDMGSSEGEIVIAGLKGFGPYKDVDPVLLDARLQDLRKLDGMEAEY